MHLSRYSFTQANLTVLRLLRSHLPEKMFASTSTFSRADYANVHDSLLTLYHAVRLHHRSTSSCQWAGNEYILPTLHKVDVVQLNVCSLLLTREATVFIHRNACNARNGCNAINTTKAFLNYDVDVAFVVAFWSLSQLRPLRWIRGLKLAVGWRLGYMSQ